MTAVLLLGFAALAAAGTPVFALMGALALWLFHGAGIESTAVIIELARLASLPSLIAIPLFVFMGVMLEKSRLADDLMDVIAHLAGSLRGGMAIEIGRASCRERVYVLV